MRESKTPPPPKKYEIVNLATKETSFEKKPFTDALLEVCTLIGCTFPHDSLITLLWEMYVLKYSDLNLFEFKLAFKKNLEREFSFDVVIENKRDIIDRKNHYNNFSGEFMTDVLDKYKELKFATIQEFKQKEVENRPKLPVSDVATDLSTFQRILSDFGNKTLIFDKRKYDILVESDLYTVSSQDKKIYMDKAKGIIQASKLNVRNFIELKKIEDVIANIMAGNNDALIYDAKRLAYIDFLSKSENKTKVENYIKELTN